MKLLCYNFSRLQMLRLEDLMLKIFKSLSTLIFLLA